jgi:SWI/SNF-related matrix-associated actin-dependent regulator 1 of chromatin subfamily A
MTQEEYEQYFCEYRDTTYGRQVSKSINLDILKRRTAGFFHRRRKADVLKELPPVTVSTVELSGVVDPEIKAEIEIALEAILEGVDTAEDILFALQTNESSLAGIRRLTGLAKASLAADHIKMRLEGGQKKIVVFAHHQDVLKALKGLLAKYNPVEISGSVSSADRDTAIELFQDPHSKARVFLGQIQAAGTAITLTQANWVVFAESDWVPANNLQALSRCHRIGQSEPVFVEFMALPGSVDLQIQRAIARKSADIDYMFA